MENRTTETLAIRSDEIRKQNIKEVLTLVETALQERGYNAVNQIAGYLISSDPAYISSYHNARTVIQQVERHEIIEELVRSYLENIQ
ncbi:MAG: IreB family regulatory phosphoprotein [Erysipelotrichaceae bacterium]|nr:IreB family regulatory phosphoprotein [Erysipelotrichaceae bacterium]